MARYFIPFWKTDFDSGFENILSLRFIREDEVRDDSTGLNIDQITQFTKKAPGQGAFLCDQ